MCSGLPSNTAHHSHGMKRLCAVLRTIMLRRTKDAQYDGKPLLQLPGRTVDVVTTEFASDDEREFYRDIENRMKKVLDKNGKMDAMGMLVMLLRLRQGMSPCSRSMQPPCADYLDVERAPNRCARGAQGRRTGRGCRSGR